MPRLLLCCLLVLMLWTPAPTRGDSFDHYTNVILAKVPKSAGAQQVKQVAPQQMVENGRVLPGVSGCLLVVRTNDNRLGKLLVQRVTETAALRHCIDPVARCNLALHPPKQLLTRKLPGRPNRAPLALNRHRD